MGDTRFTWSTAALEALFDLWAENMPGFRGDRKNSNIFREMAGKLKEFGPSPTEVKNKLENMTKKYRVELAKEEKFSSWEHFNRISNILGSGKDKDDQSVDSTEMEVENQRKRQLNYTAKEEMALVSLVVDRKDIIESTRNDAVAWKQKDAAWEEIARSYFQMTGIQRPAKLLRNKYENIKKQVKRGKYESEPVSQIVLTKAEKIKELMGDEVPGKEHSYNEELLDDIIEFNEESRSDDPSYNPETTQIGKGRKHRAKIDAGSLLQEEKLKLVKAQCTFYEQENLRAQEKHMEEMETLSAKRELLYLEIAEKKRKLNQDSSKQ